jgi:methionyl-tRNA formyltransferase
MKILFLTSNKEITKSLFDWLCDTEGNDNVYMWTKPINEMTFKREFDDIKLLISYNYKHIIKKDVIALFPQRIINLHTSLLPWNRGFSPNFWSFWEDTPKGVTIHLIDEGIDTGDILVQKQMGFDDNKETFGSTYLKLHSAIQSLFRDYWNQLKAGQMIPKKQFSFHTQAETNAMLEKYDIKWSDNIATAKQKAPGRKLMDIMGGGGHKNHLNCHLLHQHRLIAGRAA